MLNREIEVAVLPDPLSLPDLENVCCHTCALQRGNEKCLLAGKMCVLPMQK
jgi:hypothetical protein